MSAREPQPLASPVADVHDDPRCLALAGASAAAGAALEFTEIARNGGEGSGELVETACDAAKLAIEAIYPGAAPMPEDVGQVYAALCKFLEGWAG